MMIAGRLVQNESGGFMICLTQNYRETKIQGIIPIGIIKRRVDILKSVGCNNIMVEVQRMLNGIYPKVDYLLNCKFDFDSDDKQYYCWVTGDAYYKNDTTGGITDITHDN